jgi:hypothetical protein
MSLEQINDSTLYCLDEIYDRIMGPGNSERKFECFLEIDMTGLEVTDCSTLYRCNKNIFVHKSEFDLEISSRVIRYDTTPIFR